MIYLLVLMTIQSFFLVVSQILLKYGLKSLSLRPELSIAYKILYAAICPWIIISILSLFISGVIWLYVLKKYEFSVAYPLVSISYVFALIAGRMLFSEPIGVYKILGIIFIIIGVSFITKGS